MPVSEAHIATGRAGRYLAQLCKHSGQMGRMTSHRRPAHADGGAPPAARHTEWSGTDGIIDFGWGRCALRATGQELTLTAEAESEHELRRIQDGIARSLERIGRRDQLTVTWTRAAPGPGSGPGSNRMTE